MYGAKGTQAYAKIEVESAVMSASQQQLVIMLFDGASARWYARVCSWQTVISRQRAGALKSHQHYRKRAEGWPGGK